MVRAVSLIVGLPVMAVALLAANFSGQLGLIGTLFGGAAIVCFAVIAAGWTIDHDT